MDTILECDIAVVGGGLGGVAAALAAAEAGKRVIMSEQTSWLGGQITSQGVAALDEHEFIESFGGTRAYYRLRDGIRAVYVQKYGAPPTMPGSGRRVPLNPGNGWVSRLCFEPRVGLAVIGALLAPHLADGRLRLLLRHVPVAATVFEDRIIAIRLRGPRQDVIVRATYFLDATELGDLLPLAGVEYVTGAEPIEDTGEADASPDGPRPDEVQSFTFTFAVRHEPGTDHTIARPRGYLRFRETQPYTLTLTGEEGEARPFGMFETGPTGLPPFWTYRRLLDGALLDPSGRTSDVALINWAGNDYRARNLIGKTGAARRAVLDEAKRLALGFLHWLQTEAPRDDRSGTGYPGLRLVPEVMGTPEGLSMFPYIRESRRIVALRRVTAGDILAAGRTGARAEPFADSCGVGWYPMDLHPSVGNARSRFAPTLPYQIPLGALIPVRSSNLLAACKNIGTTHLSNGAYRLHPVEWNIGEVAGTLVACCCDDGCTPAQVWRSPLRLAAFQLALLRRGIPLAWTLDIMPDDPIFLASQMLVVRGGIAPDGERFRSLYVRPEDPITPEEISALMVAGHSPNEALSTMGDSVTWRAVVERIGIDRDSSR